MLAQPSEIRERIKNFPQFKNAAGLKDRASIWDEGIIDSLGILQLIQFLEAAFSIKIPAKEVTPGNFRSIESISHFVLKKIQKY